MYLIDNFSVVVCKALQSDLSTNLQKVSPDYCVFCEKAMITQWHSSQVGMVDTDNAMHGQAPEPLAMLTACQLVADELTK